MRAAQWVFSSGPHPCCCFSPPACAPQEGGGAPHPRAGPALLAFELHADGLTRFAGQRTSGVKFGVLVFSVILSLSRVPGNKWEVLPRPLTSMVQGGCSCRRDPKPRGSNQRGLWALNRTTHMTLFSQHIVPASSLLTICEREPRYSFSDSFISNWRTLPHSTVLVSAVHQLGSARGSKCSRAFWAKLITSF